MMLTATITGLFILTIVHLHFIHIRGQCPSIFKKRTDAAAFGEYCQRMAFSVERVVPERYRSQMCSYKCEQSETCVYYSYDDMSMLCVVCLRRASKFANPDTGSEIETHEPVPANLFARISVEFDENACDFLDYTCASQWFGGRFGGYAKLEIQNGERITSIQFCKDMGFRDYLGGFNITLNTGVSFIRGCMFPIWQFEALFEFEEHDSFAAFQVFYSEGYVHGLAFETNLGRTFRELGNAAGNGDRNCVVRHGDLVAIETLSGSLIDSIRFHFNDCE